MNLDEVFSNRETMLEYYLIQSQQLRETKQITAEIKLLIEALTKFPDVDRLHLWLGVAQDKVNNIESVINSYRQAISLDPAQPFWVYTTIVERLQWQNQLDLAVYFGNQGIKLYPQQPELYRQLAIVQEKIGNYQQAIAHYQTTIQLATNPSLLLYSHLLKLLKNEQESEHFFDVYDQFITLYPEHNDSLIYSYLGDVFRLVNNFKQALDAYYQSLNLNSEQKIVRHKISSLHFNFGIALLKQKNLVAAIKHFEKVEIVNEQDQLEIDSLELDKRPWPQTKWHLKEAFQLLLPLGKVWPKITIVTPSFNQGKYLEETILSVIHQEYDNLEYIVVDGLSNDNTSSILQHYQEQITQIIIEEDQGQSDAINKGFKLSTGELMMWLNSDDLLFPGALYMLALTYLQHQCDFIAGICVVHSSTKNIAIRKPKVRKQDFNIASLSDVSRLWATGHFFFQPETIFTRDLWHRAGSSLDIDLHYAMDHDLWLRFARANAKLEVIGHPIALFRKHDQQKTANFLASISELTKMIEKYYVLQLSRERKASIEQKLSGFYGLIKPKIAIFYHETVRFSQQINVELQTVFVEQKYFLIPDTAIKKANVNNYDLIILIITPQTDMAIISWLKEIKYEGILLAWMWTNEDNYYVNTFITSQVDICVPKNKLLGRIIRNQHSLISLNTNICLTQCSKKEAENLFTSVIKTQLRNDIIIKAVKKEQNRGYFEKYSDSNVFLLTESYLELTFEARFMKLAACKVFVCQPLNSNIASIISIFEALLCGLIVIVAIEVSDINELISPADFEYLSVLHLENDDSEKLSTVIQKAIFLFEQQGMSGRKRRHDFVLNHHLFVHRLKSLLQQLPKYLDMKSKSRADELNQSKNTNMIDNKTAVQKNQKQPLSFYLEKARNFSDTKPKQAITLIRKAIKLYPAQAEAYRQLGIAQEKQGDLTGQIESYTKAISLEANQPFWVYSVLVDRLQTSQQLDVAREYAQHGIVLYPNEPELYRSLGVVQDYQGDAFGVIENYSKAIALEAKQPFWVYCALAEHLCWKGRASEGEKVARQGIEIHPRKPELLRYLGLALQKQGKATEAIKSYLQAIQFKSGQPTAVYASLVKLYQESNNQDKAISICQQAIEVLPDADKSEFVTQLRHLTFLNADRLLEPITPPQKSTSSNSQVVASGSSNNSNNVCTHLSNTEYIRYIYKILLKREVDPKGLKANLRALDNSVPRTLLLENILNSTEFSSLGNQQILSDLSDLQFLKVVWELLLGRGCDPNAEKTYLGHLERGLSRIQLILELLKTGEFKDRIQNSGLLDETVIKNTGSVWIMGTERFLTQSEWDYRLLDVLCDRLSNEKDANSSNQHKNCTSDAVKQYLSLNNAPLVSVITSLYQGGKFIEHFLENITAQTIFSAIELIIIDANSPENEWKIIQKYLAKFDNINYIRTEKTIGIYEAWNIGVAQAKGQFLTNANLDDLRRFDCFEKQAEALLLNKDVDLVYQDIFYSLTPNLPFEVIEQCGYKTDLPEVATKETMLEFNSPHNAPMWRKSLHDKVGLFNTSYRSGGDYELWMRALLQDAKLIKIKDATAVYYNNPTGISTRKESHGAYEAKEIQTIYQTLFQKDLFSMTAKDFVSLSRDRLGFSGDIDKIQQKTETWQGRITFLDKCFQERLKEMSKSKFYLPLND
jgi:glycosyltransferase involved in cell wall biosynthesis/Tfp pilus assembly protein PilF